MAPDTQQNIMYTVVLIFLHNYEALGYMCGLAISTIFSLISPSRSKICLMLGFALLLFAYEYSKHIQEPLLNQTKQSLITERYSSRIERSIHLAINRVAPWGLRLSGGVCVGLGFFGIIDSYRKKKENRIGM